jgi:hypothetical protein
MEMKVMRAIEDVLSGIMVGRSYDVTVFGVC